MSLSTEGGLNTDRSSSVVGSRQDFTDFPAAPADLAGTGPLVPEELVRLDPPLTLDNFEGIAVRHTDSGATLLYLVSDDNGCSKRAGMVAPRVQRTLLLLFELRD